MKCTHATNTILCGDITRRSLLLLLCLWLGRLSCISAETATETQETQEPETDGSVCINDSSDNGDMASLGNCMGGGSGAAAAAAAATSGRIGNKAILAIAKIAPGIWPTPEPFLFCAYHDDKYPAGDERMRAPRRGNGGDFDHSAPYRMYHGDRIPGFPQHPHRGFETITCTTTGTIDHSDSTGACGRYGDGDLQWMTAGKGIVHAEMFPLRHSDTTNTLELFQIWLNLPAARKMVEPHFTMHWAEDIQHVTDAGADDGVSGDVDVTVWAGELAGKRGLAPPPDSWAASADSHVAVWLLKMQSGSSITLPPCAGGAGINRRLYFFEGQTVEVEGMAKPLPAMSYVDLAAESAVKVTCPAGGGAPARLLMLQGRPIGEPIAQHGPFVMNTQQEIQQAFADYRRTQYGGWPWPDAGMVFPKEKGRFAKASAKSAEFYPPKKRD